MSDLSIAHIVYQLRVWFEKHDIPVTDLTVILNIANKNDAAHFDFDLRKEFSTVEMAQPFAISGIDIRKFEMYGIKMQVESPLHQGPVFHGPSLRDLPK